MPIFTSIAAAVTAVFTAIGASAAIASAAGSIAAYAARTLLTIGVSRLLSRRALGRGTNVTAGQSGSRTQLPPSTDNKLPVVYGKAFINPVITDAKLTENQNIMWYVCSLAEVTEGAGVYSFGDIYWGGKKCVFGDSYSAKVTALQTNSDPVQTDTSINGWAYIWRFPDGSFSGIDTGGNSAIDLLSDGVSGGGIPANLRWNSPLYNSDGQSPTMDRVAFLVIRLEYNADAGTTGLPPITVELTNNITRPGQAIYDYMVSERYGCGIKPNDIDTLSLVALDNYSDQPIEFIDTNNVLQTQPRYRINGPINTNNNTLDNLEMLVDSVDSWLQYSELTGKWKVVINRSIEQSGQTIPGLYQINDNNLIGGINLNPIDLNSTFNQLQVQYPNKNIRDQTDFQTIKLVDYYPELLSKNEPTNELLVQYPVVNNYIQSLYLGLRRLLQSREDLVIDCLLDYSGIQIEAGDVITVNFQPYGWNNMNGGFGKLFRVSQVQEAKLEDGSLGARITAFEYNSTVYVDNVLRDFVPADNTGLEDPNIIGKPLPPTVKVVTGSSINSMEVSGIVPVEGTVLYMDFNYGSTSDTNTHIRYTSVSAASKIPFNANENIVITSTDLQSGNIYWSVTARNDFGGAVSDSSNVVVWPGNGISIPNTWNVCNVFSNGVVITSDPIINLQIGANIVKTSGNGTLANNTYVANVVSNTEFIINVPPIVPLSNACLQLNGGGVTGNNIRSNTIIWNNISNNVNALTPVGGYQWFRASGSNASPPVILNAIVDLTVKGNIGTAIFDQRPGSLSSVYFGGGGMYPFYTGTSSRVDFYQANSNGILSPAGADLLFLKNGDLNWWVASYDKCDSNVTPGNYLQIEFNTQAISNATVDVQYIPFVTTGSEANLFVADTEVMYTYRLNPSTPVRVGLEAQYTSNANITGGGVVMRILNSANVVNLNGGLALYKGKS